MLLNQCSTTVCNNCSAVERWLLHSVHHKGTLLRLCTTCVLRLHPHSFCPTCFTIYPPSPNDGIQCTNCFSISHSSCVGINPKSPYICPLCQCPNAQIFCFKKGKATNVNVIRGVGGVENGFVGGSDEKGRFNIDGNGVRNLKKGGEFGDVGGVLGNAEKGMLIDGNGPRNLKKCTNFNVIGGVEGSDEKGMFFDGNGARNSKKGGDFDGLGSDGGVCNVDCSVGGVENGFVGGQDEKGMFIIDGNDVRILEAGFAISCFSMSEAALDKRCEAERRAREAVNTRKRAKQALEHMAGVVAKEKMRRKEGGGAEVDVPRFGGNVGGVMERRDGYGCDSLGNEGGGGVLAGVRSLEKNQVVGKFVRSNMGANEVLLEVDAVDCSVKEGSGGIRKHDNGATKDVDEHREASLNSSLDVGDSSGEKRGGGIVCEISSNPDQLHQSTERNPVSNNCPKH